MKYVIYLTFIVLYAFLMRQASLRVNKLLLVLHNSELLAILLPIRGVFKGAFHSTSRVLNFLLPTVGCCIIEEFLCYTLKFAYFYPNRQIYHLSKISWSRIFSP